MTYDSLDFPPNNRHTVNDPRTLFTIGSQSAVSFEHLVESQLRQSNSQQPSKCPPHPTKRPFLRRGQGIARFGMKRFRIRHKMTSGGQLEKSHTGEEKGVCLALPVTSPLPAFVSKEMVHTASPFPPIMVSDRHAANKGQEQ